MSGGAGASDVQGHASRIQVNNQSMNEEQVFARNPGQTAGTGQSSVTPQKRDHGVSPDFVSRLARNGTNGRQESLATRDC
jgi:hypothetical protein